MTKEDLELKNEQNRQYSAKSQLTILMSDPVMFQIEIHPWGKPPLLKPTHTLPKQEIINGIMSGKVYVTNIEMVFSF
ncbi:MAG: hypothetical protein IJZ36_03965 [Bacilli bacterium]|nr:hypothetical protein [Bacilli bacterium]